MAMIKGKDIFEEYDRLKVLQKNPAQKEYERQITSKERLDPRKLCVEAYEGILTKERIRERNLLNKVRFSEYERNRPPADKWYELKS